MLSIQEIINEVNALVPNLFENDKKVSWINQINQEFFEIVNIPEVYRFSTTAGVSTYPLPNIKGRRIEEIRLDQVEYKSIQYGYVTPGHNYWVLENNSLELNPAPYLTGQTGIVKHAKSSNTTFTPSNLSAFPEAPGEYHWIYVLGLCEKVAKGMNDVSLANNYGNDYRAHLNLAQQNFSTQPQGE